MRLVLIEWVDSFGCSSSWESLEGLNPSVMNCESVGWLAYDGEDFKVVIPHTAVGVDQGCGDMTIPCCAITKITDLMRAEVIKTEADVGVSDIHERVNDDQVGSRDSDGTSDAYRAAVMPVWKYIGNENNPLLGEFIKASKIREVFQGSARLRCGMRLDIGGAKSLCLGQESAPVASDDYGAMTTRGDIMFFKWELFERIYDLDTGMVG